MFSYDDLVEVVNNSPRDLGITNRMLYLAQLVDLGMQSQAVNLIHSWLLPRDEDLYLDYYGNDLLVHSDFVNTTADTIHGFLDLLGIESLYMAHYGTARHSGRYPWGSGDNPYQHNEEFLRNYHELMKSGLSQKEVAKRLGYVNADGSGNTSLLRMDVSTKTQTNREILRGEVEKRLEKGMGPSAIAKELGIAEPTVRSIRDSKVSKSGSRAEIKNTLKDAVEKNKYIDIGSGAELQIGDGITADRLKKCVNELVNEEGYTKHFVKVEQMGNPGKYTTIQVLAAPGTSYPEVYEHSGDIKNIIDYTEQNADLNLGNLNMKRPTAISRDRIKIHYGDEVGPDGVTGTQRDGSIYVKRGVEDLDLGGSTVVQGRINVEDKWYLKGQIAYGDDSEFPPGVDIIFNTNKKQGTPDGKVFKPLKTIEVGENKGEVDWDNPFGAQIKLVNGQKEYEGKDGKKHLSAINVVNEEGDWAKWSNNKSLASQMLSKQSPELAKQQLRISYQQKVAEYEEIMSIQNPEVRKNLLAEFQSQCDTSAETLKAASLPRQSTNAIMPIASLKDNEIYAPNYHDGEKVVLIRYPHESTAQIAELTVNNKNPEGIKRIGPHAIDVVGITKAAADKMSGADFDGDTVLVIPNNDKKIESRPLLKDLQGFETDQYKYTDAEKQQLLASGKKLMKKGSSLEHIEMGKASNLITDMTLQGAPDSEVARAIKYSMTVIDAGKHELNYKYAAQDNGIPELKKKWQNGGGAGTLVSRAGGPINDVYERQDYKLQKNSIDPVTGEKLYKYTGNWTTDPVTGKRKQESRMINPYDIDESGWTGRQYTNKKGKTQTAYTTSTRMAETRDANTLSTGTAIESVYASYANACKGLANQARLSWLGTGSQKYNPSAKKEYATEVASLMVKLGDAKRNRPYEAQAQALAGKLYRSKASEYENLTGEQKKKYSAQCLAVARKRVAKDPAHPGKTKIQITEKEWEAIEAGAISANKLQDILMNTDTDVIKGYALPKQKTTLSTSKVTLAKTLAENGFTNDQIAERIGVSATTIAKVIAE